MERFLYIALIVFANIAFGNDIFKDLTFPAESNESVDVLENITEISSNDTAHHLLDFLGEHLLSNDMHKNMLVCILIKNKGSLEDVKKELEIQLEPFAAQNSELKAEIHAFIKKILDTLHSAGSNGNFDENVIKGMLPTLHIFSKQLLDRVTTF